MKQMYGVATAMVTPFDENGNISLDRLERLTEFLIAKGVHCLYPLGTTGEMLKMTADERKAVAETVVRTARGRVPVFVHVGAVREEETIELARHACEIGADGIGVVTPVYFSANDKEMEQYFVNVASSVPKDFPVYLYNIPQCSTNDLKPDTVQRIADRCGNVIGLKYSFPDLLRINEYLNVNQGRCSVLTGADRLFLPALAMGCEGAVSGVSCVYPEPFVALYHAVKDNDLAKAKTLHRIAVRCCEVLQNANIAYFKAGLKLRGIDAGFMRAPQLDLNEEELARLKAEMEELKQEAGGLF